MCVTVALRLSPELSTSSFTPVTVTVFCWSQFEVVNVSAPLTVTTPVLELTGVTVTEAVGWLVSRTV